MSSTLMKTIAFGFLFPELAVTQAATGESTAGDKFAGIKKPVRPLTPEAIAATRLQQRGMSGQIRREGVGSGSLAGQVSSAGQPQSRIRSLLGG